MDLPIAIVGIGLRLPGGCHDTESFWDLLINKKDARKPIPQERFNREGFYDAEATRSGSANTMSVKEGYFLDELLDRFDAGFFSMSQAEVERLDPNQRLLLEVVHEALENAGETESRGQNIGVYAGSFGPDWALMQGKDVQDESIYGLLGRDDFLYGNRISYEFGLHGPSMTVKTACSSSLVALHLACEALQRGDCSGAIVCAANLQMSPEFTMALDSLGVLSPDGSSKSFDASANGYVRGDAVEAVYLKRLDDATRDGNPVRAIIRGTAINSNGKTRGIYTPNPDAQATLIRRAYAKANMARPADTPFVECHGTGTSTGDPLELSAIARVIGSDKNGTTYVGSVKPNIGHGEAAAGLSSLIKVVLALEKNVIPPNIKFHTPNPKSKGAGLLSCPTRTNLCKPADGFKKVAFGESGLVVPMYPISWPSGRVKRASVNAFGMGGANAHVVVDAAPSASGQNGHHVKSNGVAAPKQNGTTLPQQNGNHAQKPNGSTDERNGSAPADISLSTRSTGSSPSGQYLLVFSALSDGSLQKMISNYGEFMKRESFSLYDLAYTLSVRRQHWNVRSFCVTDGKTFQPIPGSRIPKFNRLLFIFTGQGAQWPAMGRELIRDFPTFQSDIQRMDSWLTMSSHPPSWKIEDLLLNSSDINAVEFAQPICTALQIALVNLLRTWNILPTGVVGHSSGEIAAAYAAGALGMREALLVSYYRGVATLQLRRPGAMAALGLGRGDLEGLLLGNTTLACENSHSSVTISGNSDDVEASLDRVSRMRPGVLVRKLNVDRAYHSSHMLDISETYEDLMASIKPTHGNLAVPFFSSVTGHCIRDPASLGPSYWRSNMENPVLFLSAVESALRVNDKFSIALEIGPHATLSGPFRQICQEAGEKIQYTNTLTRGAHSTKSILTAVGHLFCQGFVPQFSKLNPRGVTLRNLPTYPWNHDKSYWSESRISREFRQREYPEHELLGARLMGGNDLEPSWRKLLDVNHVPWINDHIIAGDIVFPIAGFIAIIGEAARQLSKLSSFTIRNLSIGAAMIIRSSQPTEILTKLRPHGTKTEIQMSSCWYYFTVSSYDGDEWHNHCSGEVRAGENVNKNMFASTVETIRQVNSADWYRTRKEAGFEYGPAFQRLQSIRCAVGPSGASADVHDAMIPGPSYAVHPTVVDSLLQCCIIGMSQGHLKRMSKKVLPIHIGKVHIAAQVRHSKLELRTQTTAGSMISNAQLQAGDGSIIMQIENIDFRNSDNITSDEVDNDALHKIYLLEWKPDIDLIDDKELLHRTSDEVDNDALHKICLLEWKPDIDLIDNKKLLHRTSDLTDHMGLLEELNILCSIETARKVEYIMSTKPHLRRFKQWIDDYITTIKQQGSTVVQNTNYMFEITTEERNDRIRKLLDEALNTEAKDMALAITTLYDAVEDIFRGQREVLAVLLDDDLLTRVYNFQNMVDHQKFFELLGHGNPDLRILEIGAGTGGFTSTILPCLRKPGYGFMYDNYTYTDISVGFFKAAKQRFIDYPNIDFVELDVSQDLETQGIQLHSYDLVLASNVLHATPKLHETLSNCRSLLKPGGRLLLLELCAESKFMNYIFGFFPGWWLGELDGRPNEPYIQPEQWDSALRKAGFAGVEASVKDQQSPYHLNAVIIARVQEHKLPEKPLSLLVSNPNVVNQQVQTIQSTLESNGHNVSLFAIQDLLPASTDVISLLEIDSARPFFQDISEKDFNALIRLIEQCYSRQQKILWVTGPAQLSTGEPYHATILDLARTIRLELGSVFATLELDTSKVGVSQRDAIAQVISKLQTRATLSYATMDCEFALTNGITHVSRYVPTEVDSMLRKSMDSTRGAKSLFVKKRGLLDSLQWGLHSRAPVLQDNEIEVVVRIAPLNSWDYDVAMGNIQSHRNLGLECVGLVTRVGANAKPDVHIGDRVLCWFPGSLASHIKLDARYCIKLPDDISTSQAVTLSTAHAALFRGLVQLCSLTDSETILINSTDEPKCTAAIQIAQMIGAEIFAIVASEEQRVLLQQKHGIPQSHVFSSADDSCFRSILQSTNGRGVDVVVNFLYDQLFSESWKCIAEGGSMLDLSQGGSRSRDKVDRNLLGNNRSVYSFDIVTLLMQKPAMAQKLLQTVLDLYKNGSIQPISPPTKFQPSEANNAFQHVHTSRRTGTTCIQFPEDATTWSADFFADQPRFKKDHAYLLVGDLGALARSVAMWLAERGAGHFIFLCPLASNHASAHAAFLRELSVWECTFQVISESVEDMSALEKVVADSPKPIAGMVHFPLAVWDRPVLSMSHKDWTTATSKVLGILNLHRALSKAPLEFFVLLGSTNGIRGNLGQACYTPGNAFLTSFVQYRQQLSLPASMLDIGPMNDFGTLVQGGEMISETEFLDSFHLAIESSHLLPAENAPGFNSSLENRAQIFVGRVQRPFDARAQGLARIYKSSNNQNAAAAAVKESSGGEKEGNIMQNFMESVRANPASLRENGEGGEIFLAAQIFEAAKSLLIFDDDEYDNGDDDDDSAVDTSVSLLDLGMDSLLALELQNWWRQSMGTLITVPELMEDVPILELGKIARLKILGDIEGKA